VGRIIDTLLRRLTRTGFRRGMGGDHWAWFVVAGAAYLLNRARQPSEDVARLDLADLEPGQGYEVRLLRPARRQERRARRRAGDQHR
jgi:hypothetical protein